jgi:opacity protein-like surface antigen
MKIRRNKNRMKIHSRWKAASLAAVLLAGMAITAQAKNDDTVADYGFSFGPRAAYFVPKQSDADEVWYGGAQFRWYLANALALEASGDYRDHKENNFDIQQIPLQASVLVYLFNRKPVSLFLLGGAGWYFTRIDGPDGFDDKHDHQFGPHAGGGVQVFVSPRVSLDVTARYVWLEKIESKSNDNLLEQDYDPSGTMITGGLNFHF